MTLAPAGLAAALDDRYRIVSVIGTGGMATVYEAQDHKHDRAVALKVLHDDLAATLGPERFKREIRIAARLQHPHILSVFDSGESDGRLWFTMPYVRGESLRDLLRREGTLPLEKALLITREAAQALAYAHKQGVIHRDIKPENILLTEDGSTLVADFGIARAVGDSAFDTGISGGLTQTGLAIGTPTYMAPEQATGESVLDERVDQYALAAVLYEMLTGAPPFTGSNAAALIAARFTTAVVPVRQTRADVPPDVDTAVQRGLELKSFDRFPTISGFAQAVAPSLTTPPQFNTMSRARAAVVPKSRLRALRLGGATLALVAVAATAFVFARKSSAAAPDSGPIRIAVLPFQNLGDSADAYFADGIADELRAKLLKVPGVQVIARASSLQYAGTTKAPDQIGKELDVRYLLTGTIRWERRTDGKSVVHLRPELMQLADKGPATTRWQQAFDQPLTDVLAMQGRVAEEVASQLQVTLGTGAKTRLAALPTTNAEAYDAYLRAVAGVTDNRPASLRRSIASLERAVSLDPKFADAWSRLALTRATLYTNAAPVPELAAAVRYAAERAQASAPGEAAGHIAWSAYHGSIRSDFARAERELRAAQVLEPNNAFLNLRLGRAMIEQGRFVEGIPWLEAATRLDPVNARQWILLADAYRLNRQYASARSAQTRVEALGVETPSSIMARVGVEASLGNLRSVQDIIRNAYTRIEPVDVDVYLSIYLEYAWVLDEAGRQRVLRAPLAAFDDDASTMHLVHAQVHRLRGDLVQSRAVAEQAMRSFDGDIRTSPEDAQLRFLQAFAAALAGRAEAARPMVSAGMALLGRSKPSVTNAAYFGELRARVHVLNGDYDRAFDELETILAGPGLLARGHLTLDPMWAPLRALPRYQRIMSQAPAVAVR
ncbi:MAG: protein kinase [Gemmatimonadota bacterium]